MAANKEMLNQIEVFYSVILEEYGEAIMKIKNDSSFGNMFKEKDYENNIEWLKKCKEAALKLDPEKIMEEDKDPALQNLGLSFLKLLASFNALCDTQIKFQTFLMEKAGGSRRGFKMGRKEAKEINEATGRMRAVMRSFDTYYADYLEREKPEDGGEDKLTESREYKTYDEL